jgi:hypothetical protein
MNLMTMLRKPAATPAELKVKLEKLRAATDPAAACAALEAKRRIPERRQRTDRRTSTGGTRTGS